MHNIKHLWIASLENEASKQENSRRFSHDFGETRKKPNARHREATGVFGNQLKIKQLWKTVLQTV